MFEDQVYVRVCVQQIEAEEAAIWEEMLAAADAVEAEARQRFQKGREAKQVQTETRWSLTKNTIAGWKMCQDVPCCLLPSMACKCRTTGSSVYISWLQCCASNTCTVRWQNIAYYQYNLHIAKSHIRGHDTKAL